MRSLLIVALVLAPAVAHGKKAKSKKPPASAPAEAPAPPEEPAPDVAPEQTAVVAPEALERPTAELLAEARALYEGLEYDRVIPYAEAVLRRPDADVEMRLDAYLLHGSSLAIVGNSIDAEAPFRFLLRGRPDYDMPPDTPPKILAVFRKVQVEERAIRDQLKELERREIVRTIALEAAVPPEAQGGLPLVVDVDVTDPRGAVRAVRLHYRRQGEPAYSTVALTRESSRFTGTIPGEWTENDAGFTLELFVAAVDADDATLRAVGSADAPRTVAVAPGTVEGAVPFYESAWFWGLGATATVALVATAAASAGVVLYILAQPPPSDLGPVFID